MKRILPKLLPSLLLVLFIIGCGGGDDSSSTTTSSTTSSSKPPITLTYSAWNLGPADSETPNLERLMLDAFEEKYPHITVNVIERPKKPGETADMVWNEFLGARASVGKLPDVFFADNIPYYVINEWAYDITDIAHADSEYMNLSEDLRNPATYDGKVLSLPQAIHYFGYVVNKTLFESQNVDAPTIESTYEEFTQAIKDAADHSSGNRGVAGLSGIEHILHYYPGHKNTNLQWWTHDGEKFNLDGPEFLEAVTKYRELATDKSFVVDALIPEEIESFFPEGDQWENGNMLAKWVGSYEFGSMQTKLDEGTYTFDVDFIGTPVINGNKRVPIVADFVTIASTTKYPDEAYLLAKWMGFGKEGYAKRIELSKTVQGVSKVNFAPLQADEELLDAYFELHSGFEGLRSIIESGTFIVEPPKYLPGYINARYQGSYDSENSMFQILDKVMKGEVLYADIATQFNNRANALYNEARAQFEEALSKYN